MCIYGDDINQSCCFRCFLGLSGYRQDECHHVPFDIVREACIIYLHICSLNYCMHTLAELCDISYRLLSLFSGSKRPDTYTCWRNYFLSCMGLGGWIQDEYHRISFAIDLSYLP